MATRKATARWNGTLKEGEGTMALGSGAYEGPYTFRSRFEDGSGGTNPEELIGAALAGCFTMALSNTLAQDGHPVDSVETEASVHLRQADAGMTITGIDLVTRGRVPGLDQEAFAARAEETKVNCIVSRALTGVGEITVDATLDS
jgi:lipoyl-dependent peroxiredoxin